MVSANYKHKELDLIEEARKHLGLDLKKGVYQQCPSCSNKSSFIVNHNNTYKCHNPSCDLFKVGNTISLFKVFKVSNLNQILNLETERRVITTEYSRLEKVYESAKELLLTSPHALAYLQDRYFITADDLRNNKFDIGYTDDLPELKIRGKRLIYPIRDIKGNLVHFHTRSIDPNEEMRWLPTSTVDGIKSFSNYLWNADTHKNNTELYLTEGISDGLTLSKIDLPTISILSLTAPIVELISEFKNLKYLYVLLDNDQLEKKYKSWDARDSNGHTVIERLLLLSINNPQLTIKCLMPPNRVGIKDINDWVIKCQYDEQRFSNRVSRDSKLITDFAINLYSDDLSKHSLILKSISNKDSKELFKNKILKEQDWFNYLKSIL